MAKLIGHTSHPVTALGTIVLLCLIGCSSSDGEGVAQKEPKHNLRNEQLSDKSRSDMVQRATEILTQCGYDPMCFDSEKRFIDPMTVPGRDWPERPRNVVLFHPRACAADQRVLMFVGEGASSLTWSADPTTWTEDQRAVVGHAIAEWKSRCPECPNSLADLVVRAEEDPHSYLVELTPRRLFRESPMALDGGAQFFYRKAVFVK